MGETLNFWVVVKDGRGKWVVKYDPKNQISGGQRFEFGTTAAEYVKKMIAKDAERATARANSQRSLGDAS